MPAYTSFGPGIDRDCSQNLKSQPEEVDLQQQIKKSPNAVDRRCSIHLALDHLFPAIAVIDGYGPAASLGFNLHHTFRKMDHALSSGVSRTFEIAPPYPCANWKYRHDGESGDSAAEPGWDRCD